MTPRYGKNSPIVDVNGCPIRLGDEVISLLWGMVGKQGRVVEFGWDHYEGFHVVRVRFSERHEGLVGKYPHNLKVISGDYVMDEGL